MQELAKKRGCCRKSAHLRLHREAGGELEHADESDDKLHLIRLGVGSGRSGELAITDPLEFAACVWPC